MDDPDTDGWVDEGTGAWTKTMPGRPGEPALSLAVYAGADDPDQSWNWDVLRKDDTAKFEIGIGVARTFPEAKVAAEAAAMDYAAGRDLN